MKRSRRRNNEERMRWESLAISAFCCSRCSSESLHGRSIGLDPKWNPDFGSMLREEWRIGPACELAELDFEICVNMEIPRSRWDAAHLDRVGSLNLSNRIRNPHPNSNFPPKTIEKIRVRVCILPSLFLLLARSLLVLEIPCA